MTAIKTQRVGCYSPTLALGRQLAACVLAADFARLSGIPIATAGIGRAIGFTDWPYGGGASSAVGQ
jgi:hypothetical protein